MSITDKTPMSVEEAAAYTGYKKSYIYCLIRERKIPSYKPDKSRKGRVFLCKEEIQAYIFGGDSRRETNDELNKIADKLIN